MSMSTSEHLNRVEQLLDKGMHGKAVALLRRTPLTALSRSARLKVAILARRAGLADLTLRALNPIVRSAVLREATPLEKAVYAGALIRLGSIEEANKILDGIADENVYEYYLFKAHSLMSEWNYHEAIPVLTRLLSHPEFKGRQEFLAKLNLAACLVCDQAGQQAIEILTELREIAPSLNMSAMLPSIYELMAQAAIDTKNWATADKYLAEGEKLIEDQVSLEAFFVKKWRLFLRLYQSGFRDSEISDWQTLRDEAVRRGHWESIRDCDFIFATLRHDAKLLTHLYFGTPFEAFRQRLFRYYGEKIEMPAEYLLPLNAPGPKVKVLDCSSEMSGLAQRLLQILCRDFYRPARLGFLFGQLYPGQYFDPQSSPTRVYQAIAVLRRWLKSKKTGLEIKVTGHGYQIVSTKPVLLRVLGQRFTVASLSPLEKFRKAWNEPFFDVQDAMRVLDMSRSQMQRLLRQAVEEGTLERVGSGPATIYNFASSVAKKLAG